MLKVYRYLVFIPVAGKVVYRRFYGDKLCFKENFPAPVFYCDVYHTGILPCPPAVHNAGVDNPRASLWGLWYGLFMNETCNIRVYKTTHKRLKDLAKKRRQSIVVVLDELV